ncbi:MAG: DUF2807 domain-containing protein [Bacteroidales bacterium]|nr:DUF2807 domain-containing protein [Bacteroidales bacterium]
MKRFWVLFAALFLSVLVMDARTVKKVYDIDDFTGVKVTNAFEVSIEHSDEYRVEIEVSEEFLPYLLVKNRGGVLELDFTRLPFRLRQKERNRIAQAVISMPTLTYLELSGASRVTSNDQFANTMNKFTVSLKGGSVIANLNMKAPAVEIEMNGASKAVMSLRTSDVDVTLTGASRLDLTGETTELDITAKRASKVDASQFDAEDVSVIASGASTVDVRVLQVLTVNLTGASKCRYFGDTDFIKIRADKVTGASSFKHQN